MNIGTIVQEPLLKVRFVGRGGGMIGEVEEYFANMLSPGDTFMFAGRLLRFLRIRETTVEAEPGGDGDPAVPAYAGGRMPMTTNLADRVRGMMPGSRHLGRIPRTGAGMAGAAEEASRACPAGTTCWSRRFRAATGFTWSPTASRAATRTRRSACC